MPIATALGGLESILQDGGEQPVDIAQGAWSVSGVTRKRANSRPLHSTLAKNASRLRALRGGCRADEEELGNCVGGKSQFAEQRGGIEACACGASAENIPATWRRAPGQPIHFVFDDMWFLVS